MTLGWGIVGIGAYANAIMAPAIGRASGARLVAACSRDLERAKSFAARHGIARSYDSLEKMLQDPELDVLYIATPNNLHAPQTILAAAAGKHVLCEKPMALTEADGELMIEACAKNRVKLGVCFQFRYHPAHIEARRYLQSGAAGEIALAKVQFCNTLFAKGWQGWRTDPAIAGAGALMGQGIHCVDTLRFLMDSEVAEVRALTDEDPPSRPVDDMCYAILRFRNGAEGVMISGIRVLRPDNDVVLYGSKAKVTCKATLNRSETDRGELVVEGDSINLRKTFPSDAPLLATRISAVEAFNNSIRDGTEPDISGSNGLQMIRIANAILESSHKRRAVRL